MWGNATCNFFHRPKKITPGDVEFVHGCLVGVPPEGSLTRQVAVNVDPRWSYRPSPPWPMGVIRAAGGPHGCCKSVWVTRAILNLGGDFIGANVFPPPITEGHSLPWGASHMTWFCFRGLV